MTEVTNILASWRWGAYQGAQIMDDAFCGGPDGTSLTTNQTTLIPAATAPKVAALVFMGDPRHIGGESFNTGNATAGGVSFKYIPIYPSTYLPGYTYLPTYLLTDLHVLSPMIL